MFNDNFLIRLLDYSKDYDYMICAFYAKNITELLNLYSNAKNIEIPIDIPHDDETVEKNYRGKDGYIKEIRISFGTKEMYTTLNIYIEVI